MKYLITLIGVFMFAGIANATVNFTKPHNEYGKTIITECVQTKCGCSEGTYTKTIVCNSVNSWGFNTCTKDKVEVKKCEVKDPVACEEEGVCPTECGYAGGEVADGQGGTKVCEATEACVTPEPKKDKVERPDLDYTQGPDGIRGDGMAKLKWDNFKNCKDVRIKYTEDGSFGTGYKVLKTKDDGSEWIMTDVPIWAKIRCDKDGAEYSKVEHIRP